MMHPVARLSSALMLSAGLQAASAAYGIRSIPTLVLFKGGKEVARRSGASSSADIASWTKAQLARAGA